jgi:hypothetical protein
MVYFTDIMLSDFLNTRFAPIQEALLPLLDPTEIIALMKSSKALHDSLTRTLKTKEHNINAHLSQFFKDPRAFRSIQAAPDAVISGRYVNRFFIGSGDRLLIVHAGRNVDAIPTYLEADGYKVTAAVSVPSQSAGK